MTGLVRNWTALCVFFPGLVLAYLPMRRYLRMSPARTAALMGALTLPLCLAGGLIPCALHISLLWPLFLIASVLGALYVRTLRITRWKSVSVFLAVCGVLACTGSFAVAVSSVPDAAVRFPLRGALLWVAVSALCVAAVWYPSTHAARRLLEDDSFARTWYVFWIVPPLFIGLNLAIIPADPAILAQGRLRELYILFSVALLFLLLTFYLLFYLMATHLNHNDRLRRENQFLSMQQARYDSLRAAIAQTREARHDMRHHFTVLSNLAGQKKWDELTKYLSDAQESLPEHELDLCENPAADSVASHYGHMLRRQGVPFTCELDLPKALPVPEIDLCLVLSNLLENALEASLRTEPERRCVRLRARLHAERMVLVSVENAFDGPVHEADGVFQSSKRRGEGVGLQSVRHVAEKNGGYCRFSHENNIFCANVILRGFLRSAVSARMREGGAEHEKNSSGSGLWMVWGSFVSGAVKEIWPQWRAGRSRNVRWPP